MSFYTIYKYSSYNFFGYCIFPSNLASNILPEKGTFAPLAPLRKRARGAIAPLAPLVPASLDLLTYVSGGDPSRGFHLQTRAEKIGVFIHVFGAEGAAKNF